jgi:hypothetical protein
MQRLHRGRDAGGVSRREPPAGIEHEIEIVPAFGPQRFDERAHGVLILLTLVARGGFRQGDAKGAESGRGSTFETLEDRGLVCAGDRRERARLIPCGSAQQAPYGRFAGFPGEVKQRHIDGAGERERLVQSDVRCGGATDPAALGFA